MVGGLPPPPLASPLGGHIGGQVKVIVKVIGYTGKANETKETKLIIQAIILSTLLSADPAFINQPIDTDVLERKRSHKRRRKVRKPVKGLR